MNVLGKVSQRQCSLTRTHRGQAAAAGHQHWADSTLALFQRYLNPLQRARSPEGDTEASPKHCVPNHLPPTCWGAPSPVGLTTAPLLGGSGGVLWAAHQRSVFFLPSESLMGVLVSFSLSNKQSKITVAISTNTTCSRSWLRFGAGSAAALLG